MSDLYDVCRVCESAMAFTRDGVAPIHGTVDDGKCAGSGLPSRTPVNTSADTPHNVNWMGTCKNGHDKFRTGWTTLNGCRECKREASRRYAAARKAGVPLQANKSQARTDLGRTTVGE